MHRPMRELGIVRNVVFVLRKRTSRALGGGVVSGVTSLIPLMNSFNKTEAVIFPMQAIFL